jgi:hypothetical protein
VTLDAKLGGLKIRVSVVRFHPWPHLNQGLFRSDRLQITPRTMTPLQCRPRRSTHTGYLNGAEYLSHSE